MWQMQIRHDLRSFHRERRNHMTARDEWIRPQSRPSSRLIHRVSALARDTFPGVCSAKGENKRLKRAPRRALSRRKRLQLLVSPAGFTEAKETVHNGGRLSLAGDSTHYLLKIRSFYQGIVSGPLSLGNVSQSRGSPENFTARKSDWLRRRAYRGTLGDAAGKRGREERKVPDPIAILLSRRYVRRRFKGRDNRANRVE